ncbi:hypothetical protein FO519_010010 [Halicephalobus sp. NKZ332]|nr:hypothetical protein FO519_010010 [Halicephalobus sp. NKZ332]
MLRIPDIFTPFRRLRKDPLDDWVDRLSSTWSVYILIFCFAVATSHLYIGSPIECVPPANSPSSWVKYYSEYCFIQSFTRIPENYDYEGSMQTTISFYAWVPYVLFVQAVICFLPKFLWDGTSSRFGVDLKSILKEAKIVNKMTGDGRERRANELATYIFAYLEFIYENHKMRFTSPTAFFYILKKWLYFFGALFQFYLMALFIGEGQYDWGFGSLDSIINNPPHSFSILFPRVTFCRVPIKEHGQDKDRIFTCVMGMNVVFEKIYTFLYFWVLFVMVMSFCSAVHATSIFMLPVFRYFTVERYLKKSGVSPSRKKLLNFLYTNLHADGMLIIILIRDTYGNALAELVSRNLWLKADMQDEEVPILTKANQYESFDADAKHYLPQPETPLFDRTLPVKEKKGKKKDLC